MGITVLEETGCLVVNASLVIPRLIGAPFISDVFPHVCMDGPSNLSSVRGSLIHAHFCIVYGLCSSIYIS